MQQITTLLKPPQKSKETAPHELSASVNYIKKYIGFTTRYGAGFWMSKIKQSKKTNHQIRELVDTAMRLDKKYCRGGFICNQLK